ncbi:MAG: aldo/keto reductase, partial [Gammaproteobacteria bacterium]
MRYRPFGTTGIEVSELVFGGGAVGGLLIDADEAVKRAAVDRALEAGINWIDTAASYGQGRSEEALGRVLDGRADPPHVSTKFSVDTANLADLAGQIEASLTASLTRLKRDSVTLLQLHNPIGAETSARMIGVGDVLRSGGVLDVLDGLKGQGLIRHFGMTALGQTPSIIEVIDTGRIASAQVYFNLLNPSAARS